MKIAINTRFLRRKDMEGMGWYTYEVLRHMVENHPDDEFHFLFDRPYDRKFLFAPNVKAWHVPPPARHPILFHIWYDWALVYVLNKIKPNVFLSTDNFCSLRYKGKTALVVHDLAYLHYPEQIPAHHLAYYREKMPKFIKRADQIIAISESTRNDIVSVDPLARDKTEVIPNGVREIFSPSSNSEKVEIRKKVTKGRHYFLFVGALHPRKNVKRLIEAFNVFKAESQSDMCLVLCGRFAWQFEPIQEAMYASPFAADIVHIGHVEASLLVSLLGGADALVYPSLFEGFGLPVVEAFRSAVPVICSNTSSLPEVAGDAALLVDPTDVKQIAYAMTAIFKDKQLAEALMTKGQKRAELFKWENTSQAIYDVLFKLANS